MNSIPLEERRRRLGSRHMLATPGTSFESVAARLVGLHSSDPVSVYLSARARIDGFDRSDLERALYDDRTVLRHFGMRRTLFVVPRDLAGIMDAACTRLLFDREKRRLAKYLEDQGVCTDGVAWIDQVSAKTLAALDDLGEATARDLTAIVPELTTKLSFGEGKKWGGQVGVSTRLLFLLATSGGIVRAKPRGTWISSQYRWTRIESWLGEPLRPMETSDAQTELVRRWLKTYGPGTFTDIKWWTGWTVGATRGALERTGAVEVDLNGIPGFVLADDLDRAERPAPWVALLPSLDPTIMGWKQRDWYLGPHSGSLFDRNGNAGPTIVVNGAVVGGWSQAQSGEIRYRLLEDVPRMESSLISDESERLEKWFGETRITPRFRTPLETELLG